MYLALVWSTLFEVKRRRLELILNLGNGGKFKCEKNRIFALFLQSINVSLSIFSLSIVGIQTKLGSYITKGNTHTGEVGSAWTKTDKMAGHL